MKRIPSTTLVWAFVNPLAPNETTYMPTKLGGAKIVRVIAKQFRGKAEMIVNFEIDPAEGEPFKQLFTYGLFAWGLVLQRGSMGDKAIYWSGSSVTVYLDVTLRNGVGFMATAMQTFVQLMKSIADPSNPYRYDLPTPWIIQEDMVEAYAEDNWVPYGEYIWERFMSGLDFEEFMKTVPRRD